MLGDTSGRSNSNIICGQWYTKGCGSSYLYTKLKLGVLTRRLNFYCRMGYDSQILGQKIFEIIVCQNSRLRLRLANLIMSIYVWRLIKLTTIFFPRAKCANMEFDTNLSHTQSMVRTCRYGMKPWRCQQRSAFDKQDGHMWVQCRN